MSKILYITHRFWPYQGGSELLFYELARRSARQGHEVTVFTTDTWDIEHFHLRGKKRFENVKEESEEVHIRRFRVRHFSYQQQWMRWLSRLPFRICRQLFGYPFVLVPGLSWSLMTMGRQFDLVHAGVFPHTYLIASAYAYCRRHGIPFVCQPLLNLGEFHSAMRNPRFLSREQLWLLSRADAIITITEFEKEVLSAKGLSPERITVASPGVAPEQILGGDGETFRRQHGIQNPIVLQVSTQTFDKGSMTTVEALKLLWRKGRKITLVMIGQPMSDFARYIDNQLPEIRERILVLDYVADEVKRNAYAACDMLVMPSRADAFGIVFLEAWIYKKPVIGCFAGGIPRVIDEGETGFLIPFGDSFMLSEYIAMLLSDCSLARSMGEKGYQQATRNYTWDECANRVQNVHERLLTDPGQHQDFHPSISGRDRAQSREHRENESRAIDEQSELATKAPTAKPKYDLRRLRIGIDISRTIGERTGVGSYAAHLVEALAKIDSENEYLLYPYFWDCFPPDWRKAQIPRNTNFRLWTEDLPLEEVHRRWATEESDRVIGNVDVMHSTAYTAPALKRTPLIVTVHDLTFLTHPEFHRSENRDFCVRQVEQAIKRAAVIIADSHSTKADLLQHYDYPEERIKVVHLAAGNAFTPKLNKSIICETLAKYEIYHNYVLFVGSLEPRKNITALLKAYMGLPQTMTSAHLLVIAGASGWKNEDLIREAQPYLDRGQLKIIGYVAEEDLAVLYSAARVLVYPSWYEGFGLPVVEAMACGAPVISSNTSSLPEVAGEACILISPSDIEGLKEALTAVLTNRDMRLALRAKSLKQAACFSWDQAAREMLSVYREVADESLRSRAD
jgi:glycosyltransferase involved in cell wall biosynthesis